MFWRKDKSVSLNLGKDNTTEQFAPKTEARVHEVSEADEARMDAAAKSETQGVTWEAWDLQAFAKRGEERKQAAGNRFRGWGKKLRTGLNIALASPEIAQAAGNIAMNKTKEKGREIWDGAAAKYEDVRGDVVASVDEMRRSGQEAWTAAKETYGEAKSQAVEKYNQAVDGVTNRATSAYRTCEGAINGWLEKRAERKANEERQAKLNMLSSLEQQAALLRAELGV